VCKQDEVVFKKIRKIIVDEMLISEDKVTYETVIATDLEFDSLDLVTFALTLEDEFDGLITFEERFEGLKSIDDALDQRFKFGDAGKLEAMTIKDLVSLICEKMRSQGSSPKASQERPDA
jgi:acyl carrier protein